MINLLTLISFQKCKDIFMRALFDSEVSLSEFLFSNLFSHINYIFTIVLGHNWVSEELCFIWIVHRLLLVVVFNFAENVELLILVPLSFFKTFIDVIFVSKRIIHFINELLDTLTILLSFIESITFHCGSFEY